MDRAHELRAIMERLYELGVDIHQPFITLQQIELALNEYLDKLTNEEKWTTQQNVNVAITTLAKELEGINLQRLVPDRQQEQTIKNLIKRIKGISGKIGGKSHSVNSTTSSVLLKIAEDKNELLIGELETVKEQLNMLTVRMDAQPHARGEHPDPTVKGQTQIRPNQNTALIQNNSKGLGQVIGPGQAPGPELALGPGPGLGQNPGQPAYTSYTALPTVMGPGNSTGPGPRQNQGPGLSHGPGPNMGPGLSHGPGLGRPPIPSPGINLGPGQGPGPGLIPGPGPGHGPGLDHGPGTGPGPIMGHGPDQGPSTGPCHTSYTHTNTSQPPFVHTNVRV